MWSPGIINRQQSWWLTGRLGEWFDVLTLLIIILSSEIDEVYAYSSELFDRHGELFITFRTSKIIIIFWCCYSLYTKGLTLLLSFPSPIGLMVNVVISASQMLLQFLTILNYSMKGYHWRNGNDHHNYLSFSAVRCTCTLHPVDKLTQWNIIKFMVRLF